MNGKIGEWFRNWRWALAASLILHMLIAAFLLYGLPRPDQQPDEQQQPVNVAIVPPPEQTKPKPVPPPKAEKPPEPKPEKPPEQKVEKPPPPEPPKPQGLKVLKPVFQYGQKDTGPEKSPDGGSAKPNAPSPAKDEAAKPPVAPKPAPNQSAPAPTPQQQAEPSKPDEKPANAAPDENPPQSEEKQATEDTDKQQPDKQQAAPQADEKQTIVAPKPLAAETGGKPTPPSSAEKPKPKPKPAKPMKFESARSLKAPGGGMGMSNPTNSEAAGSPMFSGLPGVRKLYSQGATGNAFATSSMDKVSRDQRVANLCANVLNQELQSADYSPRWLPVIPLKSGNVLNPPEAAFSTTTQWYDLTFRCEVDADATRVLSFNFRVGAVVPPGEWVRRKFPSLR